MYGFINSRGEHAALEAGYLVKKAGTEMPYNRKMDDIIMAINKHCPNMDASEYIMLDRIGATATVVKFFSSCDEARRYARSSKQKRYMDVSTWSQHPVGLRQAIWDLITQ
jgi:hypothetical protein